MNQHFKLIFLLLIGLQLLNRNSFAQPAPIEKSLLNFHNTHLGGTDYTKRIDFPNALTEEQKQKISNLQFDKNVNADIRVLQDEMKLYNSVSAEKYGNILNAMVRRKAELDVYQQMIRENFKRDDLIYSLTNEINNLIGRAGIKPTIEKGFMDEVKNYMLGQYSVFTFDFSDNYINELVKNEISMRNALFKGRENELLNSKVIRNLLDQIKSFRSNTTYKYGGKILQEHEKLNDFSRLAGSIDSKYFENDGVSPVNEGQPLYDEIFEISQDRNNTFNPRKGKIQILITGPQEFKAGLHEFTVQINSLERSDTHLNPSERIAYIKSFNVSMNAERGAINCRKPSMFFLSENKTAWEEIKDEKLNKTSLYYNIAAKVVVTGARLASAKVNLGLSIIDLSMNFIEWMDTNNENWKELWKGIYDRDVYSISNPIGTNFDNNNNKITSLKIILPVEIKKTDANVVFNIDDLMLRFLEARAGDILNTNTTLHLTNKSFEINKGIYRLNHHPTTVNSGQKQYFQIQRQLNVGKMDETIQFQTESYISNENQKNYFNINLSVSNIDKSRNIYKQYNLNNFHLDNIDIKLYTPKGDVLVNGLPQYTGSDNQNFQFKKLKEDAASKFFGNAMLFVVTSAIPKVDWGIKGLNLYQDINEINAGFHEAITNSWDVENNFDVYPLPSFNPNIYYTPQSYDKEIRIKIPIQAFNNQPQLMYQINLTGTKSIPIEGASGYHSEVARFNLVTPYREDNLQWQQYENEYFSLKHPENWSCDEFDINLKSLSFGEDVKFYKLQPFNAQNSSRLFTIVAADNNKNNTFNHILETELLGLKKHINRINIEEENSTIWINGFTFKKYYMSGSLDVDNFITGEKSGTNFSWTVYYGMVNNKFYAITSRLPETNSENQKIFKQILTDLKFKKTQDNKEEFTQNKVQESQITDPFNGQMVLARGGTFTMGCTGEQGNDCFEGERPARQVTVSDFYIGKYEVTQAQWLNIMGSNPSHFKGRNLPVESVSWNDIQEFIRKLNQQTGKSYRLPTEAEWEYAARGGSSGSATKYAGSNSIGDVAWYGSNSGSKTQPVGQKRPSELGLYDMSGNVWEWCFDWYGYYSSASKTNPQGPSSGSGRVYRGGSWNSFALRCRVALRSGLVPEYRYSSLGFRLALSSN